MADDRGSITLHYPLNYLSSTRAGRIMRHTKRLVLEPLETRSVPASGGLDTSFGTGGTTAVDTDFPGSETAGVFLDTDGSLVIAGDDRKATLGNPTFPTLYRVDADGTLGTGFIVDRLNNLPLNDTAIFHTVLKQPDGKFLALGHYYTFTQGGVAMILARYNADGTLDTSFSSDGYLSYFLAIQGTTYGYSLGLQSDNRIVVAGQATNNASQDGMFFARFMPDGQFDTSFDGDGKALYLLSGVDTPAARKLFILSDGKILAAGYSRYNSTTEFTLIRLNGDGTLDTAFGTNGVVHALGPGWSIGEVRDAELLADGRVLLAGRAKIPAESSYAQPALALFNADGTPDTAFSGDGFQFIELPTTQGGEIKSIDISSTGQIVAVGDAYSGGPSDDYIDGMVMLLEPNGELNAGFGASLNPVLPGIVTTNRTGNDFHKAVQFDATKVVVVGNTTVDVPDQQGFDYLRGSTSRYYALTLAVEDSYATPENTPLQSNAPGVLANDSILDTSIGHATLDTGPTHAAAFTLNADGSFSYTPEADYTGPDSFTYELIEGTHSGGTVTVSLLVTPPAADEDMYRLPFESPFVVTAADGVLANDQQSLGGPLTAELVDPPPVGSLTLNQDGSFNYAFSPDLVGPVTFTYRLRDGGIDVGIAMVTLNRSSLVEVVGDVLHIIGSSGTDVVALRPAPPGGVAIELSNPDGVVRQTMFPESPAKHFSRVEVLVGDGHDRLDATRLRISVRAVGGAGDDVLLTGRANDIIFGDEVDGTGTGANLIEAGNGRNDISVGDGPNWVVVGSGNDTITAGNGNNTVRAGNGKNLVLLGNGANLVTTGAGADRVTAGDGGSVIATGAGSDTVTTGAGRDRIDAGTGNDQVQSGNGNDWLIGGAGRDVLEAGDGNDLVSGGAGNDLLVGGLGTDLLEGMAGSDILIDGSISLIDPINDSLAKILKSFVPSSKPKLAALLPRFTVTYDTEAIDTLLGSTGKDWFWTANVTDVWDKTGVEPVNGTL